MYKLKNMARRSAAFTAAVAMLAGVGASAVPAITFADALNPLTERSLTLSSSSPGWLHSDGSGNNDTAFAPAGSGPNGLKTGETFQFRVSTDTTSGTPTVKAFTLQYCTSPAGECTAPGNVGIDASTDPSEASDPGKLDVTKQSALDVNYTSPTLGTNVASAHGDFMVLTGEDLATATPSSGWTMATSRETDHDGWNAAGNNYITLANSGGGLTVAGGTKVWIVFFASDTNYITNPGSGAFFVKINDYKSATTLTTPNVIDGGVTVANVMNESIWITTKVLETMSFSVGTVNPDTTVRPHGTCDAITVNDQIQMGATDAEFSLKTTTAYDAHSYWRLSTNSSGGATVYYSGATLNNTVGDEIAPVGATFQKSIIGSEQFGLALDTTADTLDMSDVATNGTPPAQTMTPLAATANYGSGAGSITNPDPNNNTAKFAFEKESLTSPVAIATNDDTVTECATGKMRYIANIAPATPAGVYTTKVNYIAAPQF
jgi:hypothetical protein